MAASATGEANNNGNVSSLRPKCSEEALSQQREIIQPSVVELTKEVRTNILCTVEGCGKILPNTPALNMHLVKSHGVKDGLINPTVRKDMKGSQKLYCCPIEGCPRGRNRPFSQFSLVKQHFMKMHAEKKHKCSKCSNGYSTEWDLRRHTEDCGKTYCCTCGCPYASRAALLSHIYRTGHEVPTEHRYPPVKKRKMEKLIGGAAKVKASDWPCQQMSSDCHLSFASDVLDPMKHNSNTPRTFQKVLLPKPKVAVVNVPVIQLAHLPVLLPSDSGALRSVVLAVDSHGSLSTLHLLPQSMAAVVPHLDPRTLGFRGSMQASRSSLGPISTGVQVSLEPVGLADDPASCLGGQRGRSTSTNIQTDMSFLAREAVGLGVGGLGAGGESSVSSCSQTDISVSAQVLLPVSVETQTFSSRTKATSTIAAQTENHVLGQLASSSSPSTTRQTQTRERAEERVQLDQAIACSHLFEGDSLSVSTQTALSDDAFPTHHHNLYGEQEEEKSAGGMCFGVQTDDLQASGVADNQTQTMALINDLANILSDSMAAHQGLTDGSSGSSAPHAAIDFDFEEFLNAVHIQTQTEESELSAPLESLDTHTQTDFLLLEGLAAAGEGEARSDLELEMFDTQTQTDLNFLLSAGSGHVPLGNILRQSSFSMSTESSDNETQTDLPPSPPRPPHPALSGGDPTRMLSTTETQTASGPSESLGHLFLTSNETQTVMDDFLSADLAWNVESHFSSVETQTCQELFGLFQNPDKPNS
ncbi:ATM interactor [Hypomesus transpacificus]|uniref:ATM interactor n=1 Tax=Hypomesus transpacificus TaxID=137520 RepID=UPI001F085B0F|nr:ATM interactor [Hypomesus transpacificus]